MHEPLNSRSSFLYKSTVFQDIFPVGFQSQLFWGLVSSAQDLMVEGPDNGVSLSLLRQKIMECNALVCFFFFLSETISLSLLHLFMLPPIVEALFILFLNSL